MPESAGLVLLEGATEGRFVEHEPELVDGSGLALADLDGDHDLDALILDASGPPAYRVALNHGDGRFDVGPRRRIVGRYGGELDGAALADVDGDAILDAVVPLWDSVRVLPGDGRGGFGSGFALAVGRDPHAVAVADLDGDGRQDLVVTSMSGPAEGDQYDAAGASAWIYLGAARRFAAPLRIEIPGASQVAIADLDGDGRLEAVVSGAGGLTVLRGPWDAPTHASFRVVSDGPLVIADVLAAPGPELLTPSYIQSRLHVLAGYPDPRTSSVEAGSFVVDLFVARIDGVDRIVLLDAGPPGGPLGAPAPAIEVLFLARDQPVCVGCEAAKLDPP